MAGAHLADSPTVNPHKMMNVPATCSFLLGPDMQIFHKANTLPAGYLFHGPADDVPANGVANGTSTPEVRDLADLTLQCRSSGRQPKSLR